MNAILRAILVGVVFGGAATAAEPQVRVAASREIRVAVIDGTKATPARDAMHQAFAASVGASLARQCGGPVGVRAQCVGIDHAAFNLKAGVFDAVLVVGRTVPEALRRVDTLTLSAVPENAKRDRTLFLLIASGDDALQGLLAAAFSGTVRDGKFLGSFAVADGRAPVVAGERVAAQEQ